MSSQNSIYQIVNGTLSKTTEFKFSLFVNDFTGVIFYCIDSEGYEIGVFVLRGSNNDTRIRLSYKSEQNIASSKLFCACDPCDRTIVTFHVRLNGRNMNIQCNNRDSESVYVGTKNFHELQDSETIKSRKPLMLANRSDNIYVTIGNIGPYQSSNHRYVSPRKEQMIGCLRDFHYNNKSITFSGNNDKVRSMCVLTCDQRVCNGGICKEVEGGIICDCAQTMLNGMYCNNSLIMYSREGNNSYGKMEHVTQIYFKLTWRTLFYKKYCLLQIINGKDNLVMKVHNDKLMLDSQPISDISKDGMNMVIIFSANNRLNITTMKKSSTIPFSLNKDFRANVGFSEKNSTCELFEGTYDIYINSSLKKIIKTRATETTITISTEQSTLMSRTIFTTTKEDGIMSKILTTNTLYILLVVACCVIMFVIWNRINRYLKLKRKLAKIPKSNQYSKGDETIDFYYSTVDYDAMQMKNTEEGNDGYMVPVPKEDEGLLPPLPPRLEIPPQEHVIINQI